MALKQKHSRTAAESTSPNDWRFQCWRVPFRTERIPLTVIETVNLYSENLWIKVKSPENRSQSLVLTQTGLKLNLNKKIIWASITSYCFFPISLDKCKVPHPHLEHHGHMIIWSRDVARLLLLCINAKVYTPPTKEKSRGVHRKKHWIGQDLFRCITGKNLFKILVILLYSYNSKKTKRRHNNGPSQHCDANETKTWRLTSEKQSTWR